MRVLPCLLMPVLVAGCAGQLRDYMGSRASIVRPQLIRYGLSVSQIACVGGRLGDTLRPRQLRFLTRIASQTQRPFFDPDRFSARDLLRAAGQLRDQRIAVEVSRALAACQVELTPPAPPEPVLAPVAEAPPPAAHAPTWVNLGAAGSGQAIAVEASTLEQDGTARTAWFRMIDPAPRGPSLVAYRLRLDCATRTIRPLAHRRYDAAGAVADEAEYAPAEQMVSRVEGGTVTEIAFLSLCT